MLKGNVGNPQRTDDQTRYAQQYINPAQGYFYNWNNVKDNVLTSVDIPEGICKTICDKTAQCTAWEKCTKGPGCAGCYLFKGNVGAPNADADQTKFAAQSAPASTTAQMAPLTLGGNDRLFAGEYVGVHKAIVSRSGQFVLTQHMDGRLVLYDRATNTERWASGEGEMPLNNKYVTKQEPTGALVTYLDKVVKWASNMNMNWRGRKVSTVVQDNGVVVTYVEGVGVVWRSSL